MRSERLLGRVCSVEELFDDVLVSTEDEVVDVMWVCAESFGG